MTAAGTKLIVAHPVRYERPEANRYFPETYLNKVRRLLDSSLIGYWPIADAVGSATAKNENGAAGLDGAHTAVTLGQPGIGDGLTSGLYDGATSFTNIYSAALAAAFNGQKLSLLIFGKTTAWSDVTIRYLARFRVNASNDLFLRKTATAGQLMANYTAGGTNKQVLIASGSPLSFFHFGMTIDLTAGADGEMIAYFSGIQSGVTQTTLGTWAGSLASSTTLLGAADTTPSGNVWNGFLAHTILCNIAHPAATIAELARVP